MGFSKFPFDVTSLWDAARTEEGGEATVASVVAFPVRPLALERSRSSAELALLRAHVEATLSVLGRKKGKRYLLRMATTLADAEIMSVALTGQPDRQGAIALFEALMPIWLGQLESA